MCFELERLLLDALGDAATVADEVQGFRYFEARDLLGFVDGTENPTGSALPLSSLIQHTDDPDFEGGSYIVACKNICISSLNGMPYKQRSKKALSDGQSSTMSSLMTQGGESRTKH